MGEKHEEEKRNEVIIERKRRRVGCNVDCACYPPVIRTGRTGCGKSCDCYFCNTDDLHMREKRASRVWLSVLTLGIITCEVCDECFVHKGVFKSSCLKE